MDIKTLSGKGAFVQSPPVPKEVTWTHEENGEEITDTFTVFVRRMSVGWMDRVMIPPPAPRRKKGAPSVKAKPWSRTAALLAGSILWGENGEEEMTYAQADSLDIGLSAELMRVFNEVNNPRGMDDEAAGDGDGDDDEAEGAPAVPKD
jgi:hypothetical protein